MKLSVKDVARLFDISEKTVYRWIQTDSLPYYRIGGQYRFNYSELLEWSSTRGESMRSELSEDSAESDGCAISIENALNTGGIHYRLEGRDAEEILASVVKLMNLPESINRDLLLQFLIAREKLGSTAIGDGIAIPHVRNPVVVHLEKPQISLFFLENSVDFGALDGEPVSKVFLILSPNIRCHLAHLARLMFVLRDEGVLKALKAISARNDILTEVRRAEAGIVERASAERQGGAL